jgi:hypothetical protein
MDEATLDAFREELSSLETEEARISAERRRLHNQIDSGFGTDAARAREREVSDERQRLHRRIDALRKILGVTKGPHGRGGGSQGETLPDHADAADYVEGEGLWRRTEL